MTTDGNWYAVRVRPGSQRMAKYLGEEQTPEHKIGETILERECRQEGVTVFMPAVWLCVLKHRGRKFVRRRLPLFTGYAFVHARAGEFESIRDNVDSITAFLRHSKYSAPAVFGELLVSKMAVEDFERYQNSRYEQTFKEEKLRVERIRKIREERSQIRHSIAPKGRRKDKLFSQDVEKYIETVDVETRARWHALGKELKALEDVAEPIENQKKIA